MPAPAGGAKPPAGIGIPAAAPPSRGKVASSLPAPSIEPRRWVRRPAQPGMFPPSLHMPRIRAETAQPMSGAPPDPSLSGAALLDHLTTGVLVLDRGARIVRMNSAAEALLDTSMQAARGAPLREIVASGELLDAAGRTLDTMEPLTERALAVTLATGRTCVVDSILTPVAEPRHARKVLVELIQLDRHHQITREEGLLTQVAHARNLVRRLGHEIKNPLGGLRGAAQLLRSELPDAALREYTDVIIREADRLTALVDRMVEPRRLPRMEPVNIHEVTERVRALVSAETPRGIVVERDYDPSIPDLAADPELLIQAMLNIARNAVRALGERGRIVLRTRIQRRGSIGVRQHRLMCRIDVADDGPGIPDDLVDSMFYPLVSGRDGGAGLGLSIAQSLVNEHGGLIECASRPGETTFSILLPMDTAERGERT